MRPSVLNKERRKGNVRLPPLLPPRIEARNMSPKLSLAERSVAQKFTCVEPNLRPHQLANTPHASSCQITQRTQHSWHMVGLHDLKVFYVDQAQSGRSPLLATVLRLFSGLLFSPSSPSPTIIYCSEYNASFLFTQASLYPYSFPPQHLLPPFFPLTPLPHLTRRCHLALLLLLCTRRPPTSLTFFFFSIFFSRVWLTSN
jgi:hypothetical protein